MMATFKQAFEDAGNVHPMVHTDRGSSFTFNKLMTEHEVIRSIPRPGTPYDNAPMERWWNEFKLNWLDGSPNVKN